MIDACTDLVKKRSPPAANGHGGATAGKKRALEQGSGDSASSSGEEDASGAPGKRAQSASQARKKRRNVLPAIRKDQRCGHCRTCLNPQVSSLPPFAVMYTSRNHEHEITFSACRGLPPPRTWLRAAVKESPTCRYPKHACCVHVHAAAHHEQGSMHFLSSQLPCACMAETSACCR